MKLPGSILKRGNGKSADTAQATAGAEPTQATAGAEQTSQATATAAVTEAPGSHACPNCKAPMAEDQDWCGQCGTNDGRSMRAKASWYSAGALVAVSAIMASGAAAAGVAALSQEGVKEEHHGQPPLVAQVPQNSAPSTPPAAVSPGTPETLKTPHGKTASTLTQTASSSTHSVAAAATQPASPSTTTTETTTTTSTAPEPIELQAQQLSVYNPGGAYPASALGDPRRNYEEGTTTLWSVQVTPPGTTQLNVGLLVHLGAKQRIGKLEVITSTPGYALEVLGTKASKPPATISDTAWTKLGEAPKLKKKATLSLHHNKEHFNYILLWIEKVPASLAGSAGSPSKISIDELALFPAAS